MYQEQQFTRLLARNEDWIIAKILVATKDYNQPECQSLINLEWKQTVKTFSEEFLKSHKQCDTKGSLLNNSSIFQKHTYQEAKSCYERNIEPHTYLSFLKVIRGIYEELISEANLISGEKVSLYQLIGKCFDCIEVAFIKAWAEFFGNAKNNIQREQHTENLSSIFNSLPIPVLFVNQFHRIVKFNDSAKSFFPYLFEKGEPKFDNSIRIKEKDALNAKIDEFRISSDKEIKFETTINTFSGNFYMLINIRKIKSSDDIMISFIDLSHRKSMENKLQQLVKKAEESDRLKTMFLANMSHEIRTPMNAIVGFSELLSITNPKPKARKEYLSLIKKSSNDLLNIIEDVIDIAKIESKQLKISNKATKPAEIILDLSKLHIELLERQGNTDVKFIVNIPENEKDLTIRTDPKRLKQVLSNLLGNASKFTETGTIEIGFKMAENKLIYFYVKDTGIGIPYSIQPKVFEQFVQVEKEYTKNHNGTGLGLTISKNIVGLLGGKIWVSSVPGKGSNFYFYLPNIKPQPEEKTIQSKETLIKDEFLASKTLLVAEDEDSNFLYLRESLKKSGIKLIRAKTGSEAINIVEKNDHIDLILMDIKMPEINGIDATKYINHIKPQIPIIAQTAFAMENDRQICLDAGCIEYITKPIKIKQLIALINKYSLIKSPTLI